MNNYRITIIVPIYNLENYIDDFFNNLLNQTFQDFKIIAVNDCSKDRSLDILKKYKSQYPLKIEIINNDENKGLGLTRDVGLDSGLVEGDYVMFLDGDDYPDATFLEKMIKNADESQADITICGFERFDDLTGKIYSEEMTRNYPDYIEDFQKTDKIAYINPSVWNKLYRRSIIKEHRFTSIRRGEDLFFLLKLFPEVKSIKFVNEVLFHYRVRYDSLINTIDEEAFDDFLKNFIKLRAYYSKLEDNSQYIEILDLIAFIHIGISYTYRLANGNNKKRNYYIKKTKDKLDCYFLRWKNNKYLNFKHCILGGSKKIGLWGCRLLYKINMFGVFIKIYLFIIEKLKVDIKW